MQIPADILSWDVLPRVLSGLQVAMLLVLANALRMMLFSSPRTRRANATPESARLGRLFALVIVPAFLAVYVYQASWQLTGFARPRLLDFMRRYNPRSSNLARRRLRGAILDRGGVAVARTDPAEPGRRRYPLGAAFAHLVGYIDPFYGLSGLEDAANAYLYGYSIGSINEVDRYRRNMFDRESIMGNDLPLTVDRALQVRGTELMRGRRGAIVALRPADGAILALVSAPAFDPEHLAQAMAAPGDAAPLFNRAIHGLYPPGSTFKILTSVVAIESGQTGRLECPAEGFRATRGAKPIRDHEYYAYAREGRVWRGYGALELREAFAKSSNVYFAQLGANASSAAFTNVAARFQLDRPLTLYAGSSGSVQTKPCRFPPLGPDDRRERAQVSIGQGRLLVTPMHMALAAATVAGGGVAHAPRVTPRTEPRALPRAMSPATAARLKQLMREAVRHGTGSGADLPGLEVCGKTGTAQAPKGDDHSWFVCFAPGGHPEIAMAVVVENGGYGSRTAVPIAADLLDTARRQGLIHADAVGGGVP